MSHTEDSGGRNTWTEFRKAMRLWPEGPVTRQSIPHLPVWLDFVLQSPQVHADGAACVGRLVLLIAPCSTSRPNCIECP